MRKLHKYRTECHEIVLLLDILEGHTQLERNTTCLVQLENVSCDTFLKASDASACATKDSWHLESCWRALNEITAQSEQAVAVYQLT